MKNLRFAVPVDAAGRFLPWVNEAVNRSGVYLIRDKASKRLLYVGESHTGRLGDTLKRHFYAWRDDAVRKHHTYKRERVTVALRFTPPGSAVSAQDNLIAKLSPRDNVNGQGGANPDW